MNSEIYSAYKLNTQVFNPVLIKTFGAVDGLLLNALIYWQYSQKLYDTYFEYHYENIEKQTGFTKEQQLEALNSLLDKNILITKYEGVPAKCFIQLNELELAKIFNISKDNKIKVDNIAQFKQLGTKHKTIPKGKNKFQLFYQMATERFSDKDLLDLLYKYLQDKIGAISHAQWEICLKHLEDYGLQYPAMSRKTGMLLMVEKAIAGGWFDFYKISDYELQQHTNIGYNQFGERIQTIVNTGDTDAFGKNCNFDLAVDENGNPIKF